MMKEVLQVEECDDPLLRNERLAYLGALREAEDHRGQDVGRLLPGRKPTDRRCSTESSSSPGRRRRGSMTRPSSTALTSWIGGRRGKSCHRREWTAFWKASRAAGCGPGANN